MATIWIDGTEHEVDSSKNVLEAALSLGYDLPYFCWHPALGSVGACRQCAVKQYEDEDDEEGKLVMGCMTPASDGTRVSLDDEEARDFRARVIEWLMVNHPHDCPVCDEGGECHLQDMTVMTGHTYREFRFSKRTYRNQDLGPFINHEMNRCIQCYRCVRFYRDYAGGGDLAAFAAHDHVYFGRHEDGPLEREFSGNLVEICPTGVFTDRTLKKHYTRKWDLRTAPSVCHHCSLGCNTIPGERYGTLRRIRARYNGTVNGYFLCDRGRYGYEFVNHERRLRHPVRPGGRGAGGESRGASGAPAPSKDPARAEALGPGEAVEEMAFRLGAGPGNAGSGDARPVLGIGSPRASLEGNFALRALVGEENFHRGEGGGERSLTDAALELLRSGSGRAPSLARVEDADAVLVLGEDPTNAAPMLELALRQAARTRPLAALEGHDQIPMWHDLAVREAVQDERGPFFVAFPTSTKLDAVAGSTFREAPEEIARLGRAVARELDDDAPEVADLAEGTADLARETAQSLRKAERPLVVSGTSLGSRAVLDAAGAVVDAMGATGTPAELFLVLPECNSMGAALLGGRPLEEAFRRVEEGEAGGVVVLENDLYRRAPREDVERFLEASPWTLVLDHLAHDTGAGADLVVPAATFAEGTGTLVSNEGRAQRFFKVFEPEEGEVRESWRWMAAAAARAREGGAAEAAGAHPSGWRTLADVHDAMAAAVPSLAPVKDAARGGAFRIGGARVPREPHRYSGRTAMKAPRHMHEPPPPVDPDAPFTFSMEGYQGRPPGSLASHFHAPGWNSVQALNRFQEEVGGPLRGGDPGVRLVEPSDEGAFHLEGEAPDPFRPREGKWRVIPLHHCFGSEELSVLSPGIAERAPEPYVALGPEDAQALGLDEGEVVAVTVEATSRDLPLRILAHLPRGCAGLPGGIPGMEGPVPELRIGIERTRP